MENQSTLLGSSFLFSLSFIVVIIIPTIVMVTIFLFPVVAVWADSNASDEASNHGSGHARAIFATDLGWISIGAGVLANVPLVFYMRIKRISVVTLGGGHEITRKLSSQHNDVLNFHMIMNMIGFISGMAHGALLVKGLDAISFSLALTMTILVASGIILRLSRKSIKNFARLFHGQIVLSGLLILLVILHVVFMRG